MRAKPSRHTQISLSAYRPKTRRESALRRLIHEEIATLRRNGHITDRPVPVVRTSAGEILVILEWATPDAVGAAHKDDEVLEVWRRKALLADYIGPGELDSAAVPFVSYPMIDEV